MGSQPTPPPAPDPVATAAAQSKTNRETAITQYGLNATNQVTPYGNLTYSQAGNWSDGTPHYTATQTLSPEQQRLYELGTQTQANLGQMGVDQSKKISDILNTPYDLNAATSNQQSDIQRKLLDPVWQARDEQLRNRLANAGVAEGSEAWRNAERDFGDERDRSYNNALLATRGQAATEALTQRNQPLNEITALLSNSQVSQPNFTGTPQTQVAPTDYLGAVGLQQQGLQNAYNQQMAQQNAIYGALGSMAGTIGGVALGKWGGFKP